MGDVIVIRPRDDGDAKQASDWCDALVAKLESDGHTVVEDVADHTPAEEAEIVAALGRQAALVLYFGHGDETSWLTYDQATVDGANVKAAAKKAVVSIACKTGHSLAPAAIGAGVSAWLGFTMKVPVVAPHKHADPVGEAIAGGLEQLGTGGTLQQARDSIATNFHVLVDEFDTGGLKDHPAADVGYYASLAMKDRVGVHGSANHRPL